MDFWKRSEAVMIRDGHLGIREDVTLCIGRWYVLLADLLPPTERTLVLSSQTQSSGFRTHGNFQP